MRLKILPVSEYVGVNQDDPIRFYSLPIIGGLYRQRVERCLNELKGGERILEIGFGTGVTFFNLNELFEEIYGLDLAASVEKISGFYRERGIETYLQNGNILNLPYSSDFFDAVLLISILEHLKPSDQHVAFSEIKRVLKPGGQVVFGVPVESTLMSFFFRLLGYRIHEHHFSSEQQVIHSARHILHEEKIRTMHGPLGIPRNIYQIGHFTKEPITRGG